ENFGLHSRISPENQDTHVEFAKSPGATPIPRAEADNSPIDENRQTPTRETEPKPEGTVDQESRTLPENSNTEQQPLTGSERTDAEHPVLHDAKPTTDNQEQTVVESGHLQETKATTEGGVE